MTVSNQITATQSEYLTVNEYAERFSIPIDTVRSRIRLGKVTTKKIERAGKTLTGVLVELDKQSQTVNEYKQQSNDRQLESSSLSDNNKVIEVLDSQIEALKADLLHYKEVAVKWEGEANAWRTLANENQAKVAELTARLEQVGLLNTILDSQKETILAQKIANEAMNNERIVITQQLQKYRTPVNDSHKWWEIWKKQQS